MVFEVISPNHRLLEMIRKFRFYERFGVEEYYVYDPETGELTGFRREGSELLEIPEIRGWVSPRRFAVAAYVRRHFDTAS